MPLVSENKKAASEKQLLRKLVSVSPWRYGLGDLNVKVSIDNLAAGPAPHVNEI